RHVRGARDELRVVDGDEPASVGNQRPDFVDHAVVVGDEVDPSSIRRREERRVDEDAVEQLLTTNEPADGRPEIAGREVGLPDREAIERVRRLATFRKRRLRSTWSTRAAPAAVAATPRLPVWANVLRTRAPARCSITHSRKPRVSR